MWQFVRKILLQIIKIKVERVFQLIKILAASMELALSYDKIFFKRHCPSLEQRDYWKSVHHDGPKICCPAHLLL